MKRQHIAVVVFLSLLGSLAYISTLQHDFVWDDNFQIVRNPFLHHDESVIQIFTTDVWGYTKPQTTTDPFRCCATAGLVMPLAWILFSFI